jgi:hypothetical protein
VALVKPGRSLAEVDVASVKRKMKDKAFAKGVRRDDIAKGAAELGVPLDDHIATVIEALRQIAPRLGLDGARGQAQPAADTRRGSEGIIAGCERESAGREARGWQTSER